jgi:hypothetical protein
MPLHPVHRHRGRKGEVRNGIGKRPLRRGADPPGELGSGAGLIALRLGQLRLRERHFGLGFERQRRRGGAGRNAGFHDLLPGPEIADDPEQQPLLRGRLDCVDPGDHHVVADLEVLLGRLLAADGRFGPELRRCGLALGSPHLLAHDPDIVHGEIVLRRTECELAAHRIIEDSDLQLRIGKAPRRDRRLLGCDRLPLIGRDGRLLAGGEGECVLEGQDWTARRRLVGHNDGLVMGFGPRCVVHGVRRRSLRRCRRGKRQRGRPGDER